MRRTKSIASRIAMEDETLLASTPAEEVTASPASVPAPAAEPAASVASPAAASIPAEPLASVAEPVASVPADIAADAVVEPADPIASAPVASLPAEAPVEPAEEVTASATSVASVPAASIASVPAVATEDTTASSASVPAEPVATASPSTSAVPAPEATASAPASAPVASASVPAASTASVPAEPVVEPVGSEPAPEAAQAEVVETVEDIVPEGAEVLETDLLEVQDESNEAELDQVEVEDAVETVEALESICLALEACAAHGGLNREAAAVVGVAVDAMYKRVGVTRKSMPALESFGGGVPSRVSQTQLAMESIKETVVRVWKQIIEAVRRAAAWFMAQIDRIFQAGEKLSERAERMKAAAGKLQGTAKSATVESASLVKALHVNGNVKTVVQNAERTANFIDEFLSFKGEGGNVESALEMQVEILSDTEGKRVSSIRIPAGRTNVGKSEGFDDAGEGFGYIRSNELLGGKAFIATTNLEELTGEKAVVALSKIKYTVGAFNPNAADTTEDALPALSVKEIEAVATAADVIGKASAGFRKEKAKLQAMFKEVDQAANLWVAKSEEIDGEISRGVFKAYRLIASSFAGRAINAFNSMNKYGLSTGKALLDYAELSAKQYSTNLPAVAK